MNFDSEILISLARTLGIVEINDEHLVRYEALVEFIRRNGGTMHDASRAIGLPITYQTLTIVVIGQIYNWVKGGGDAALTLPEPEIFEAEIAADDAPERELVKRISFTTRLLAWADLGDQAKLHEAGKELFNVVQRLLETDKEDFDLAISLCLQSRRILESFKDQDARLAQLYAYRMLVLPKRLPFLPDLPPSKYPPPLPPAFQQNVLLQLCLDFIQKGVLDEPLDLNAMAMEMWDDPKAAIKNKAQVVIDGEVRDVTFEMAFGHDLIRWAWEDDEWAREIGADGKLRSLLSVLCKNTELLEGFRDDDFGYVYQTVYLGFDYSPDRLSIALKIESFGGFIRLVVGISTAEVRTNNTRDHIFSERRNALLDGIKANIAAEA